MCDFSAVTFPTVSPGASKFKKREKKGLFVFQLEALHFKDWGQMNLTAKCSPSLIFSITLLWKRWLCLIKAYHFEKDLNPQMPIWTNGPCFNKNFSRCWLFKRLTGSFDSWIQKPVHCLLRGENQLHYVYLSVHILSVLMVCYLFLWKGTVTPLMKEVHRNSD